jgi:type I restriction enzyme S subunit
MVGGTALIGRYRAYPEYRPSEIESTTVMPIHWVAGKVKYVTESLDRIRVPLSAEERGARKGEYPYYGASGIIDYVDDYLFDEETILFGEDGANLIARSSPLAFLAKGKYWVNNHAHILRTKDGVNDYWVMCLENIDVTTVVSGSAQPKLTAEVLGDLNIVYPPTISEREKIANFLDHEIAKIDTLIDKQQQLITLLKEKRQAVISHAVTKGLNPNTPMRDSGVEWLGEVPAHWDVVKLSYRYEVLLGKMLDDKKITGDYLGKYLRNTDVQWDSINTEDLPQMDFRPVEQLRYSVKKGDLIVCEGGEIGRSAIWEDEVTCFYQKALHRLRPYDYSRDHTRFMFYVMFDAVYQERFSGGVAKATIAHLPAETFRQYKFAYPPYEEQLEITGFLNEMKGKFEAIESSAKRQINLLQERRTALISAAVTGKIDVRNWQVPFTSNKNKEFAV